MSSTSGKDLRAHTWPQNMVLLPSGTKRVNDVALHEWIKRYDPTWCQFVPHHSEGRNDAVMNDLVHRQLVQRLIDQCLYAVASWNVENSPGLWNTLLLLPYNTSGLIGAVFSSVGKPELPTPSGTSSLAGPTCLFEDPVQRDVLHLQLRSFCPFSEPIQLVGRDQHHDELNSATTSEPGSNEEGQSPDACETPPEQQYEWAYTQPAVPPRFMEPATRLEATESPQQTFAFDFDVESGVWVSTDPHLQLGNAFPKDLPDWFTLSFPEPLA